MKTAPAKSYHLATLKDPKYLSDQLEAGKILSETMRQMVEKVHSQSFASYLELSQFAESIILKYNAFPTFKGYKGFPEAVCISVNNELVHGIPKTTAPKPTDLVSLDFGVTLNQAVVDSALTISAEPSLEHQELIFVTQQSLYDGIQAIGLEVKIGAIGEAIYKSASKKGYSVVQEMGGHGLGYGNPHEYPFIANKDSKENGIRIQPNMTFAIEPLVYKGSPNFYLDKDGWSVYMNHSCAHFEHTIQVRENELEIVTWHPNFDVSNQNISNIISF